MTYIDYVKEVIRQTGLTPELLAKEFHLDEANIISILKKEV
jgi:hypothetical protein